MTKKKNSILSDQRFVVLLVIIALSAVFSFMSKEFRQYTTILSMLDFSYYDLLMAIGVHSRLLPVVKTCQSELVWYATH